MIQDSGERREFDSGAVRDIAEGKGRCDLMPLNMIGTIIHDDILVRIGCYIDTGNTTLLVTAYNLFVESEGKNKYSTLLELAKHFEEGCKKYGERNWEKGIPLHCFIDSAVRHYLKYKRGDADEPHDRAFLWNIVCAIWTQDNHPELIDLPFAKKEQGNDDDISGKP